MKQFIKSLLLSAAAMLLVVPAFAQFTTSSLSGIVTDESGEPLAGTTVVAVHTPSGSQYYAVANAEGYYTIQGMRPGGPYEVTYSMLGCQTVKVTDITLQLSETYKNDATLKTEYESLGEAIVSASTTKFTTEKTGASTNVSNRELNALPNSGRSIAAITKLSPYSNGMSFAGSDGRSTNFTVDGANLNNNFGLSSSLPGGGTPISIDALDEVQLVVAPYDVRQSNFVGGGINAVTKSGTNTFKGTAYAYYTDQNLRGNKIGNIDLGTRAADSNTTYGFTLGGPIVKNKLFFFVNFEYLNSPGQVVKYQADAAKQAVLQQIKDKLIKDYGYDPGSYTDYPGGTKNIKLLARIDWNISDAHKFSVRFSKTKNETWNSPNGNSCDDNFRNNSYNRASAISQPFSSNLYSMQNNVMTIAAELNSRFSDKVSNKLLATYSDISDIRGTGSSQNFPHIDIMSGDLSSGNYIPYTSLGTELFSYNNGVYNKVINVSDDVTIYAGSHTITAGASYEFQSASNAYMRNGTGYYRFASPEDFLAGNLPVSFAFCYGYNGVESPRGEIKYSKIGAYAQDEWNITKKFKLTYGLRADMMAFDNSTLLTNKAIYDKDFGGKRVDTGKWPAARVQISPRIGFNWDIKGDKTLVLRGGTGFFQGRLPLVFFTNMPQNAGMIQNLVSKGNYSAKITDGKLVVSDAVAKNLTILNGGKTTGGHLITDRNQYAAALGLPTTIKAEDGYIGASSDINAVDPEFRMPQIWKTSVALDYSFPTEFPFSITAEGMFNKTLYGVMLQNWQINESKLTRFSGSDNRYIYNSADYYQKNAAYVLTNTNKGWGYTANITINMEPAKNLHIMAAYTHTESKEVSGMPGSAASSAFQGLPSVDGPNYSGLQRSQYVVPDKLMASVSYLIPFKLFEGKGLNLSAYYTAYAANANSFIYSNDMNGDGVKYDLIYIPKDVNDVQIGTIKDGAYVADPTMAKAFMNFVNNDKYLSKHKGEYAEAYSAYSPWVHKLDLRVSEDFAVRLGNSVHTLQFSVSIDNFLNMLNPEWGVQKISCYQTAPTTNTIAPLKYEGMTADKKPVYSMVQVNKAYPTENYTSYYKNFPTECWRILFGIKYFFN